MTHIICVETPGAPKDMAQVLAITKLLASSLARPIGFKVLLSHGQQVFTVPGHLSHLCKDWIPLYSEFQNAVPDHIKIRRGELSTPRAR